MLTALGFTPECIAAQTDEEQAVRLVVERWISSADEQDVAATEEVLYEGAKQFVLLPQTPDRVIVMTRERYIELMKAGRVGGAKRELAIDRLEVVGGLIAGATIRASRGPQTFRQILSLVKAEGMWRVVSVATTVAAS